jgi:transcriptional regulator with XRE-family HTH domain
MKVLADNVRHYRVQKKISQETLANIAEIERSQVSRLERGVLNTSVSVIFAIAKALDVKPSQLLRTD